MTNERLRRGVDSDVRVERSLVDPRYQTVTTTLPICWFDSR